MNILETYKECTPVDIYMMTESNDIIPMRGIPDDTRILCVNYIIYHDDDKGDMDILSIQAEDGVYCTNSATFIKAFLKIKDMLNGTIVSLPIKKASGESKAGRSFVTCTLDIDRYNDLIK